MFLTVALVALATQQDWKTGKPLTIGLIEGENELTRLSSIYVDRNRHIWIAQDQDANVKVFDEQGAIQRTIGRKGSGPGEFQAPMAFASSGDGLWITDYALARFAKFDSQGQLKQTLNALTLPARERIPAGVTFHTVLANGSILAETKVTAETQLLANAPRHRLLAVHPRLGEPKLLADLGTGSHFVAIRNPEQPDRAVTFVRNPFSFEPYYAFSPDADRIVIATQDPPNGQIRLITITPEGDTVSTTRLTVPAVRVTSREYLLALDAPIQASLKYIFSTRTAAEAGFRRALPQPSHFPIVTGLIVGGDSTIWIRGSEVPRALVPWLILDSSGKMIGRLTLPGDDRLLWATKREIYVGTKGPYDVPLLKRLPLLQ